MENQPGGKKKCILCCLGVLALIVVAVPVGLFVLVPQVVGNVINSTDVMLDNATLEMSPAVLNGSSKVALVHIQMTMDVPGFVSAHVKSFPCTLKTNGTEFARFQHPAVSLGPGKNHIKFSVPFDIVNNTALLMDFGFPLLSQNLSSLKPWMLSDLEISGPVDVVALTISTSKHNFDKDLKCKLLAKVTDLSSLPVMCRHGADWISKEGRVRETIPGKVVRTMPALHKQGELSSKVDRSVKAPQTNLAVSFADCGDASYHAKVTDVEPKQIATGSTTDITGSAHLDEDIPGATFEMEMTGLGGLKLVQNCAGDGSQQKVCDIQVLGVKVGSLTYKPISFPIKAGDVTGIPTVAAALNSGLPPVAESTTTTLKVTSSNGDKVVCVKIMTTAAEKLLPLVV